MEERRRTIRESKRPQTSTLRGLLEIGFRRRRLLTISFLVVAIAAIAAVLILPNQYQAEIKVLVERTRTNPVMSSGPGTMPQPVFAVNEQDVNSEVDLLQSQDLLEKVVLACNIWEPTNPWSLPGMKLRFLRAIGLPPTKEQLVYAAVQGLQSNLNVQPPKNSNLITVTYQSSNPHMAAKVLNTLASLYLEKHLSVHRAPGTVPFFQKEVDQYQRELSLVADRLIEFNRKEGVVNPQLEKVAALQQLSQFDATLASTRASIAESEGRIRALETQITSTPKRDTTQIRTSPTLLEQLKTTLFQLELKRTDLLSKFNPGYRLVQDVDTQIADTKAAIAEVEKSPLREETTDKDPTHEWLTGELAKTKADLAALHARAGALSKAVREYREKATQLDEKGYDQQNLLRSVNTTEQNYVAALQKREEARVSDALDQQQIVNVAIAEAATIPALPTVGLLLKLALAFLLSLVVSVGLAFAAEYWDPTFRSPEEVEEWLDSPVLAALPRSGD
jgi:uncharacterized protein involved in exopolysaccharide biosynthesis